MSCVKTEVLQVKKGGNVRKKMSPVKSRKKDVFECIKKEEKWEEKELGRKKKRSVGRAKRKRLECKEKIYEGKNRKNFKA